MSTIVHFDELSRFLPHRFENILIDEVTLIEKGHSTITLTINPDDSHGRDIFLDRLPTGEFVLARPIALEVLATASIVTDGGLKDSQMIFFSGLTSVQFYGDFKAGVPIKGTLRTSPGKRRSRICYHGELFQNGKLLCTGNIIAFLVDKSTFDTPKRTVSPAERMPEDFLGYRRPSMTFISGLSDSSDTECSASFVFPTTHPLNRGHFPDFPVMMGVLQLMVLEELATHFLMQQQLPPGLYTLTTDAKLFNSSNDDKLACTCRGLVFEFDNRLSPEKSFATLKAINKLSFKGMILPGDSVSLCLETITFE